MTGPPTSETRLPFVSDEFLTPQTALLAAVDYLEIMIREALSSPFLEPNTRTPLEQAWRDASTRDALGDLRRRIREASLDQLLEHGLAGAHLDMKRGVIRHFDRQYWRLKERRVRPSMLGLLAAAFDRVAGLFIKRRKPEGTALGKIFEGLKSLFGSALDALHIGGLIKELLEFITACITESAERVNDPLFSTDAA